MEEPVHKKRHTQKGLATLNRWQLHKFRKMIQQELSIVIKTSVHEGLKKIVHKSVKKIVHEEVPTLIKKVVHEKVPTIIDSLIKNNLAEIFMDIIPTSSNHFNNSLSNDFIYNFHIKLIKKLYIFVMIYLFIIFL